MYESFEGSVTWSCLVPRAEADLHVGTSNIGIVFTSLGKSLPTPEPVIDVRSILAGAAFGIATFLALGVDFPGSNKRFARLV